MQTTNWLRCSKSISENSSAPRLQLPYPLPQTKTTVHLVTYQTRHYTHVCIDEDPDDELAALFEEHLREQAEANSAAFEEPVSNLGSSLKIEDHPSTSRIPETPAPHPVHVKPEPMELDRLLFKDPIPAESYGPFHDSGDSTIVKHEGNTSSWTLNLGTNPNPR
jgi:hypothetical protein